MSTNQYIKKLLGLFLLYGGVVAIVLATIAVLILTLAIEENYLVLGDEVSIADLPDMNVEMWQIGEQHIITFIEINDDGSIVWTRGVGEGCGILHVDEGTTDSLEQYNAEEQIVLAYSFMGQLYYLTRIGVNRIRSYVPPEPGDIQRRQWRYPDENI